MWAEPVPAPPHRGRAAGSTQDQLLRGAGSLARPSFPGPSRVHSQEHGLLESFLCTLTPAWSALQIPLPHGCFMSLPTNPGMGVCSLLGQPGQGGGSCLPGRIGSNPSERRHSGSDSTSTPAGQRQPPASPGPLSLLTSQVAQGKSPLLPLSPWAGGALREQSHSAPAAVSGWGCLGASSLSH